MWGAMIMEKMGSGIYRELAYEARKEKLWAMGALLEEMQKKEEEHEKFFASILKPQCNCRYLRYLNGSTAREVNPFCRAEHKY